MCFNTAMTGYQEILTDPSYAGQIITFTFPHIGNVGTNDEDIETVNMAALSGVRGVVLKADITNPANYRAAERLDAWLKKRNIVGIAGIDTRALTARIRESGMPNGVVAHAPDGYFDEALDRRRAQELPGLEGLDLAKEVTTAQTYQWDQTPWAWNEGYGKSRRPAVPHRRRRLRRQAQHPAPARRPGRPGHRGARHGHGARYPRAQSRRHLPQQRPGRSGRDRQICRADDQGADGAGKPIFGICLGHQLLGLALGGTTEQDASGPSRRQSSGQGPHHRQGRDHLDEPRLRRRRREPAPPA